MKALKLSERTLIKFAKETVVQCYSGEEEIKKQVQPTYAGKVLSAFKFGLQDFANEIDCPDPDLKNHYQKLYDDLMYSGVSFDDLRIFGIETTNHGVSVITFKSDRSGEIFYIFKDENQDWRGYNPSKDIEKDEAKLYDFQSNVQAEDYFTGLKSLSGTPLIPGTPGSGEIKNACEMELSQFHTYLRNTLGKWCKDLLASHILPGNLGINPKDTSFTKMIDSKTLEFMVSILLLNPEGETYGPWGSAVKKDLDNLFPSGSIEDFEITRDGLLGKVPFIECRARTQVSPWVYYYLYLENKSKTVKQFRAYVPSHGNWIFNGLVLNQASIPSLETMCGREGKDNLWDTCLEFSDLIKMEPSCPVPYTDPDITFKDFSDRFPQATTIQQTVIGKKKNDIKALKDYQIKKLVETLSESYALESNSLISQLKDELKIREEKKSQIDLSQFIGKLMKCGNTIFKIHSFGKDEILADILKKEKDYTLLAKNKPLNYYLTSSGKIYFDEEETKEILEETGITIKDFDTLLSIV